MKHLLLLIAVALTVQVHADIFQDMEPPKLEVPEITAEQLNLSETSKKYDFTVSATSPKMDFDFFKSKTKPDVKPYKFMDDVTFVGIPLFVAGWVLKSE